MLVCLQQRVFLRVVTATSSQLPPSPSCHLCKVSVLPRITDLGRATSHKPPPFPPAPLPGVHLAVRHLKGARAAHFSGSSWACSVSRDLFFETFYFHLQSSSYLLCPNQPAPFIKCRLTNGERTLLITPSQILLNETKKQGKYRLSQHKNTWWN